MKPHSRFLNELMRTLAPLAQTANTAVACVLGQEAQWLAASADCRHRIETIFRSSQCPDRACQPERTCQLISFGLNGDLAGRLMVCCPLGQTALPLAVEHLVHSLARQVEMEQEQEQLLEELGASWESLEAVYEISSDANLLANPHQLLERIINRAAGFHRGLKAVLWIERDDLLYPLVRGLDNPGPRRKANGLVEQVISERNGIILNGRPRIAQRSDLEPEFRNATNLALAPLTSQHSSLGVLGIWREGEDEDFDSYDMRFLAALALQAAMVIENDRLHRTALESERLRQEIEIGSKIQQTLLLGQVPGDFPGLKVAALSIPSQMIDGDFYDFIKPHNSCLDVISGDVMGKGIPAALVGAATKTHFLRAMCQLLALPARDCPAEPHEIVARAHAELVKQLISLESFVTLCYARFDLERRQVRVVDCGHTRAVHYRGRTGTCALLQGVNLPIGFSEQETYEQFTVELEADDLFVFYSDGLTEATNTGGEQFGEDRLVELLRNQADLDPEELVAEIHRRVIAFAGKETLADDLTCVAVKILPPPPNPGPEALLEFLSELRNLEACRAFVRKVCLNASPGAGEEFSSQLELAVNEAVTNVMRHAYEGRADQPIQLTAETRGDGLALQIRHQGHPFDPATAPEPVFDGSQDGGFGLFIIARSVDQVDYFKDDHGWNCISLLKKFNGGNQNGNHTGNN